MFHSIFKSEEGNSTGSMGWVERKGFAWINGDKSTQNKVRYESTPLSAENRYVIIISWLKYYDYYLCLCVCFTAFLG